MTASKPRRTMLPPNLTRNLYETRRLLAADEGKELPPWFALTKEQRHDAEMDMDVFRRAIIRAEEEQDLVASATAATDTSTPFTDPAAADCPCPGCILEAAILDLLKWAQRREQASRTDADSPNTFPFNVSEVTESGPGRPRTSEEADRAREAAKKSLAQWVAAGKPLVESLRSSVPGDVVWTFDLNPPLSAADLRDVLERELRLTPLRPFWPKV
ncbi:hypothetical protein QJ054_33475 [Streptomyces sp. AN-3]|uniref:hypothetical protein n=1 Tax=Streptomyces sp. AN-3 TaxID=3044177 RepID=UPI00249C7243|nr:hypothetical protein [Streptomyces sp. AN-3]MDI3101947.1 hypothetical protein [Streptomyces sp. AN-3]